MHQISRIKGKCVMRFIDGEEVARRLSYEVCIPIVRDAMIAFSKGETRQLLRSIIPLSDGRLFGIMPGALGSHAIFGAKLISVFHENFARGVPSHQGLIVLFDPETGAPVCVIHAGEVTAIRTAAASAVATARWRAKMPDDWLCLDMASRLHPCASDQQGSRSRIHCGVGEIGGTRTRVRGAVPLQNWLCL